MYDTIVFADFDGTITMEDTLVGAIRLFAAPEEFQMYSRKLAQGEITLSQVVRRAFDGASPDLLPRMLEYVKSVPLRPGFADFLDEMDRRGVPVVVISGGVRQFVEQTLAPFRDRLLGLHAVDLDVSGPQMRLVSAYDDGSELLKKTSVMALYEYRRAVGIGDSFTDRNMSRAVDVIFARDILAQYLEKLGAPYLPYEDFYDVIRRFPACGEEKAGKIS